MTKCHFCKEGIKSEELGKSVFFCPRLRNYSSDDNSFYGDWTHLDCCKKSFFDNMFSWHKKGMAVGNCNECDFPIGACLFVKSWIGDIDTEKIIVKMGDGFIVDNKPFSIFTYPNFKWDGFLKVVPRSYDDSLIQYNVMKKRKLPIRVIVTPDHVRGQPPQWSDLRENYWSVLGHEQHFREEKWMDDVPVIFGVEYFGDGFKKDKHLEKTLELLKLKLKEWEELKAPLKKWINKKGYAKALRDVRGLAHKVDDNSFTVYYSDLEELKKKGGSG